MTTIVAVAVVQWHWGLADLHHFAPGFPIYCIYTNIQRIFFPEFSEEKLGCAHYLKQGWYCSASKQNDPAHVKEWSANHVLSGLWLQHLIIARSRQRKSLGLSKKQETLETVQREESMMWEKVIYLTGQKTNCDLQRRIVIVGHFVARKQGIRNLKKGYAIRCMIKANTDAQLLLKCANWKF